MSRAVVETQRSLGGDPDEPAVQIKPRKGWLHLDLGIIWSYRELLYFLVWRDLKVRYRQTAIGAGWVLLQPLLTMVLLTVVFGNLAKIPSDGLPYPIFSLAALLPWTLFANSLSRGSESVVGNSNLVTISDSETCRRFKPLRCIRTSSRLTRKDEFDSFGYWSRYCEIQADVR